MECAWLLLTIDNHESLQTAALVEQTNEFLVLCEQMTLLTDQVAALKS